VSQILGQSVRSGVAEEGLAQAQVLQQLGRAVEAKQIYREILASDPLNARVVHYLGMAEHQTGERELGRTLVDRSILLAPQNAAFFSNRGSMAEAMGDPSVAQRDFQRAITLQPALPEARANLGSLLVRSNEIQAAIRCFHSSIVLAPVSAQPWLGISLAVGRQADKQTAVIAVQRVVTLDPLSIDGLFQLGSLHHLLGESQAALTSFSKLATLRPDHGEYIFRLAAIQDSLGQRILALRELHRVITLDSCHAVAVRLLGRFSEEQGDLVAALKFLLRGRAIEPDFADGDISVAAILLLMGRYSEGWRFYEARWRSESLAKRSVLTPALQTSKPNFDGSTPHARVLIWAEQGLGDEVMFGSLLEEFSRLCGAMILQVDRRLVTLFTRAFPNARVLERGKAVPEEWYDQQIPIGSLGKWLRSSRDSFEGKGLRFLRTKAGLAERLRAALGVSSAERLIGLSWFSVSPTNGSSRSLSLRELTGAFRGLGRTIFLNLQYGDVSDEIDDLRRSTGINVLTFRDIDNFEDLEGLAGLIECCDLVVSVGNATAHLSGALGQRTWVILPQSGGWRWFNHGHRCAWYQSVRVFRQSASGSWDSVLKSLPISDL